MRRLRKASVIVSLSLLLLFMGRGELHLSPIEMAAAPYLFDLFTWEVSHLPDKWAHKLWNTLPWNSRSYEEKLEDMREFFQIGENIRDLERDLTELGADPQPRRSNPGLAAGTDRSKQTATLMKHLDELRSKRSNLKPGVEETLESEVSAVLDQEGLSSRIGLIFPPVDVALSNPPNVLVVSPRETIERMETVLLKPDMKLEDMDALEEKIFQEQGLSALVLSIGGLATYPTIVKEGSSLQHTAVTTAHEWLHAYWFFRPLGWNIFSSPNMNTLNETAASLAGRELGNRVYEAMTGEVVKEQSVSQPSPTGGAIAPSPAQVLGEERFDFGREMRETRLTVDELLSQGRVEEAEAYMEERRQLFVKNGFFIRKLNQAYFAFHGSYGGTPASVSPIGDEVEQLRKMTGSVGDFIRTMSGFGSYPEFLEYLARQSDPGTLGRREGAFHRSPDPRFLKAPGPCAIIPYKEA